MNGRSMDAYGLGHLGNRQALIEEFAGCLPQQDVLGAPTVIGGANVGTSVPGIGDNGQVPGRVVELIAIKMVDMLKRREGATQFLLHDMTVLFDPLALDVDDAVALAVNAAARKPMVVRAIVAPNEMGAVPTLVLELGFSSRAKGVIAQGPVLGGGYPMHIAQVMERNLFGAYPPAQLANDSVFHDTPPMV